jgi:hypothetical protein
MSVNVYYNSQQVDVISNISYGTNMEYSNDIVANYGYTVNLQGVCTLLEQGDLASSVKYIKEVFSSNGGRLLVRNNGALVLFALNGKVQNINFDNSANYWSRTIPFTVTIEFEHLHLGTNLDSTLADSEKLGFDEIGLAGNFASPYIRNLENYKVKSFEESFNLDITDDNIKTLTLVRPLPIHDYTTIAGISQNYITNTYYTINYTLSAVGKHSVKYSTGDDDTSNKLTLPAWEHAKRWVHTRLAEQVNSMFVSFMSNHLPSSINQNYLKNGDGIFDVRDPSLNVPSFGLFNENYVIDVSESDGKYSVQYTAIVKQKCPSYEYSLGCSNNAIHEIKKSINKNLVANEATNLQNQEISVVIDGTIRGLVPSVQNGVNVSPIFIDNPLDSLYRGTFLVRQNTIYDRNDYADQLLQSIFDPFWYDFTEPFKRSLGLTPDIFGVNPDVILRPSRMNLTRNFLEGTISYNAEYNNKYNCLETNYETTISVDMPVPIIAEFTIPNNNYLDVESNEVCSSGYSVIQKLGTTSTKKITVNINGNPGFDFGKCCVGSYNPIFGQCEGNLDLLELSYFSLKHFEVPSGVVIPVLGDNYVLTSRQKTSNFPQGDFNITLEYICADVCGNEYFND